VAGEGAATRARAFRQFHEAAEAVTLAKVLVLPDVPTMGARLDLRAEGVEGPLSVVGVTLRPIADGPGVKPTSVEVLLFREPMSAATLARAGGWSEPASVEIASYTIAEAPSSTPGDRARPSQKTTTPRATWPLRSARNPSLISLSL
jgi:hypothetical protein